MAEITAALVKELREKSGVGMMDCKKALTENNGDIEASIDWLRAKGLSKAAKKADRVAAEGLVAVALQPNGAGMIGADAAKIRGDGVVHIGGDRAGGHAEARRTTQHHVLADGGDQIGDHVLHDFAAGGLGGLHGLHVALDAERGTGRDRGTGSRGSERAGRRSRRRTG